MENKKSNMKFYTKGGDQPHCKLAAATVQSSPVQTFLLLVLAEAVTKVDKSLIQIQM